MSFWIFIAAMLTVFLQAGFIMMEAGSTRSKNAGNTVMKNLMSLSIGLVAFSLVGFSFLSTGDTLSGVLGIPSWGFFQGFSDTQWGSFVYQAAICAVTVSIISGGIAERIKFSMYCLFVVVFVALIYPVGSVWIWSDGGWLQQLGFVDYAGAAVVNMAGGIAALVGAAFLGPRVGKYEYQDGKVETINVIPGQSVLMDAVGCLIIWLGWYGFNGAKAGDGGELGQIFVTTTLCAGFASASAMVCTWIKYEKPDVYMSLNGALAGLVAIAAGCANVDPIGAIIIGIIAGPLVCFGIGFVDNVLHVDDPIGAVGVHGICGAYGALAVGLFDRNQGLFYGGGLHLFGVQLLGIIVLGVWVAVAVGVVLWILNRIWGLRVSREEEIEGLDRPEHGIVSSYGDFAPVIESSFMPTEVPLVEKVEPQQDQKSEKKASAAASAAPANMVMKPAPAIPSVDGVKYSKVTIVCNPSRFEALKSEMSNIGVTGMTVTQVVGCGVQRGKTEFFRGVPVNINLLPKLQVDIVVSTVPPATVVEAAKRALYTGKIGDGKIFLYDVENVIRVRTGEMGVDALTDPEEK